ncbi:MAG: hypothetical protein U0169_27885, partial [Polyangiaceae bacterium]
GSSSGRYHFGKVTPMRGWAERRVLARGRGAGGGKGGKGGKGGVGRGDGTRDGASGLVGDTNGRVGVVLPCAGNDAPRTYP